jgi:GcrA cell cycle regulator
VGTGWTADEINVLRDGRARNVTCAAIAAALGRTIKGIHRKSFDLRLGRKPVWTAEDERVLSELYPGSTPTNEIAAIVGKSPHAVTGKASRMGLAKGAPAPFNYTCKGCGETHLHSREGPARPKSFCPACLRQRDIDRSRADWRLNHPNPRHGHSDETKQEVARLWVSGQSATKIATALGLKNRCVVLGLVTRLGLSGNRPKAPKAAATKLQRRREVVRRYRNKLNFTRSSPAILPRVKAGAFVPYTDAPPVLSPLKPYAECVTMEGLKPHHCRFPVDGDGDMRYCGEDKIVKSYCLTHHIEAHRR